MIRQERYFDIRFDGMIRQESYLIAPEMHHSAWGFEHGAG